MRHVFAIFGCALLGSPALAGVCSADREADIALFEEAKTAFLAAEYRRFVVIAGPYFPDLESNFGVYFGQIQVVHRRRRRKNGQRECQRAGGNGLA